MASTEVETGLLGTSSREGSTTASLDHEQLLAIYGLALVAKLFTNLNAIPGMSTLSMLCCCILAETLDLKLFLLALVPVGIVMGLATWGYLQISALIICVALQIPLSIAFLTHRSLVRKHPLNWMVTLAFPSVNTALWVLSFFFLPIGSIASPAYDLAGQQLLLTQCSAWFGRSGVTFILSWIAAAGAHRVVVPGATRAWRAVLLSLFLLLLAGGVRFYATTAFMGMQFVPPAGEPADYHRVSCLSMMEDMYTATEERLKAGDTIVMHTEVSTGLDNDTSPVPAYVELLQRHYEETQSEALLVLSFRLNGMSWYYQVTKDGPVMSYAKNHPVPVIEAGLIPGPDPPSVADARIVSTTGTVADVRNVSTTGTVADVRNVSTANARNVSTTGTISFDTDFPLLTRPLHEADLLLETSATWSNIGQHHLQGHQYVAIENGQTLVKCTYMGFTGVFDPYGSYVAALPQTTGVVSFMVPPYPKLQVFPWMYTVFDSTMGLAACVSIVLALWPEMSSRLFDAEP